MKLQISDIPEDLEDILDEYEICCGAFSGKFDKAMLENKFFDYGSERRSHRIITSKARALTTEQVICALTGLTEEQLKTEREKILREIDIAEMFRIADKYGFQLI